MIMAIWFPFVCFAEVTVRRPSTLEIPLSFTAAELPLKDWLRAEWLRSGIPFYRANAACGVKNAATRKYLTADHLWYFPPPSGDVIWEPFGGLCSGSVAAFRAGCHAYAAEIDKDYFQHACERLTNDGTG